MRLECGRGRRAARRERHRAPDNVLVRAVRLLQAAAAHPDGSTALELARAAGVPRASAARLVATLGDAGLLDRGRHGWVVGAELHRLARRADPHAALARRSRPHATRLAEASGESVTVSVPQGLTGIEVIVQVDAPNLISTTNWIGRLFALHASSAGKVMLADLRWPELEARYRGLVLQRVTAQTITDLEVLWRELERVRRQGYAESLDELEDGLVTLGRPRPRRRRQPRGDARPGRPLAALRPRAPQRGRAALDRRGPPAAGGAGVGRGPLALRRCRASATSNAASSRRWQAASASSSSCWRR